MAYIVGLFAWEIWELVTNQFPRARMAYIVGLFAWEIWELVTNQFPRVIWNLDYEIVKCGFLIILIIPQNGERTKN